jgi:hypothetical protein
MKRPALRRARKSTLLFVIAALLFLAGLAGTTLGYFDGETDNVATWSGGFVYPPTLAGTLGSVTGYGQTITWTTPTTTGVQGYVFRVTDMGTSAVACPAQNVVTTTVTMPTTTQAGTVTFPVTYPQAAGSVAAPTGTGVATVATTANGNYVCYQVAASWTTATPWYSPAANANATAVRAGLFANTVAEANVASNNNAANTDTLTVTYNQNVSASGTISVCAVHVGTGTGALIVGDGSGCAGVGDTASIGKITGVTVGATTNFISSSIGVTGTQLKITLGGAAATTSWSGSGTWVPSATGTVVSSAGAAALHPCSQASCSVTATGHF